MARLLKTVSLAGIAYALFLYVKQLLGGPEPQISSSGAAPPRATPPPSSSGPVSPTAVPSSPSAPPPSAAPPSPRSSPSPGSATASTDSEPSKAELYERAKELEIEGRSKMSKDQLRRAIAQAS